MAGESAPSHFYQQFVCKAEMERRGLTELRPRFEASRCAGEATQSFRAFPESLFLLPSERPELIWLLKMGSRFERARNEALRAAPPKEMSPGARLPPETHAEPCAEARISSRATSDPFLPRLFTFRVLPAGLYSKSGLRGPPGKWSVASRAQPSPSSPQKRGIAPGHICPRLPPEVVCFK